MGTQNAYFLCFLVAYVALMTTGFKPQPHPTLLESNHKESLKLSVLPESGNNPHTSQEYPAKSSLFPCFDSFAPWEKQYPFTLSTFLSLNYNLRSFTCTGTSKHKKIKIDLVYGLAF